MSKIHVYEWYITVLVYKWYVKVTKMSKIDNSGIQTVMYENLVHMSYTRKRPFLCCGCLFDCCQGHGEAKLPVMLAMSWQGPCKNLRIITN